MIYKIFIPHYWRPLESVIAIILTLTLIPIISSCSRKESDNNSDDSKCVLTEDDFFIEGLYYRADSVTVIKAVGIPDSISFIKPSERIPQGLIVWKYADFWLYFNPMRTLDGIRINHAGFLTTRGLSVGDSLNRAWELYGSQKDYGLPYGGFWLCYNDDDTTCITIQAENGLVKSIYVGRNF